MMRTCSVLYSAEKCKRVTDVMFRASSSSDPIAYQVASGNAGSQNK